MDLGVEKEVLGAQDEHRVVLVGGVEVCHLRVEPVVAEERTDEAWPDRGEGDCQDHAAYGPRPEIDDEIARPEGPVAREEAEEDASRINEEEPQEVSDLQG